jgi:L-alanine-DL-glutamate epimerase-like enolase superfamily enzyme
MIITDVQTVLLTGPCTEDPFLLEARKRRSAAFVEIHTDAGIVGLGETYAGYSCPEPIPAIVEFFKPILVGQSPDDIGELWKRMYRCGNYWCRVGLGAAVITALEAALWDLRGKALNQPVHALLGGAKHASLPAYATGGPSNHPPEKLRHKIEFYLSLGFKGFKIGAGWYTQGQPLLHTLDAREAADLEAKKMQFVRGFIGKDVTVLMDGHMGNTDDDPWTLPVAAEVMKALAPFGLGFFEEALPYTDLAGYRELCRVSPVPIAGGECLSSPSEWQTFIEQDAFHIGQPDAAFMGGLGPFVQVAGQLAKRGQKVATHAWGAGGALMQNVHAGFACANTLILEIPPAYGPLHREIVGDSFVMRDGRVLPPTTPGLGIRLTDDIKRRFAFVPGSGEFNSVPGKVLRD